MSADNSVHDHLTNEEYNMASEVWYHAELVLKQCVEAGDGAGALDALDTLKEAVYRRFQPILTHRELASTLLGILGGILHFACRDAGLPPAYLTLMILWQKETFTAVRTQEEWLRSLKDCIRYACELVRSFSLPSCGPLIRRCIALIQQGLTEELHAEALAGELGVTRPYLSSQFKKETGKTLTEYINAERIKLARHYLRQGRLSVTQVALLCGYSDPNYFGRIFRRLEGLPPQAFAEQYRLPV